MKHIFAIVGLLICTSVRAEERRPNILFMLTDDQALNWIPAGWSSDQMLSTMDLLPTFASIARGELPDVELDGKDATQYSRPAGFMDNAKPLAK